MKKTMFIVMLLASFQAFAGDDWSEDDTAREIIWQTINVVDWGQTLDIADKCRTMNIHERNPLLRRCPTFSEVNKHFIAGALLHFGASYVVPVKYRPGFQWMTIGFGVNVVGNNVHLGLRMQF